MKLDQFISKFTYELLMLIKNQHPVVFQAMLQAVKENASPYTYLKTLAQAPGGLPLFIYDTFQRTKLPQTYKSYCLQQPFQNTPFLREAIDYIVLEIVKAQQFLPELFLGMAMEVCSKPSLEMIKMYEGRIQDYAAGANMLVDERLFAPCRSDNRRIRRMDSLARLLSLSKTISVCCAVGFFNGECIIAYNADKRGQEKQIEISLMNRIRLLQTKISDLRLRFKSRSSFNSGEFKEACKHTAETLLKDGGTHVSLIDFEQAAFKVLSEFCREDSIFTRGEQDAFLYCTPILHLPSMHLRSDREPLSAFHAERMIRQYVETKYAFAIEPSIQHMAIGITKLCCLSCWNALQDPRNLVIYHVSGTHGQSYTGVMDCEGLPFEQVIPKRNAILTADKSPWDTPTKTEPPPEQRTAASAVLLRDSDESAVHPTPAAPPNPKSPASVSSVRTAGLLFFHGSSKPPLSPPLKPRHLERPPEGLSRALSENYQGQVVDPRSFWLEISSL